MKLIKLTQGKFAKVDDEDFEYINQWKWHAQKDRNGYYACRGVFNGKNMSKVMMHRIINKTPLGLVTDHIDHDTLNNQKNNLRSCTQAQNTANKSKHKKKTSSKYLGVCLIDGKYWTAALFHNGKRKHIGSFKTEEQAAKAYDMVAIEIFGEFANLNFK